MYKKTAKKSHGRQVKLDSFCKPKNYEIFNFFEDAYSYYFEKCKNVKDALLLSTDVRKGQNVKKFIVTDLQSFTQYYLNNSHCTDRNYEEVSLHALLRTKMRYS